MTTPNLESVTWADVFERLDAVTEKVYAVIEKTDRLLQRVDAVEHRSRKLFGSGCGASVPGHDDSSTSVTGTPEGNGAAGCASPAAPCAEGCCGRGLDQAEERDR